MNESYDYDAHVNTNTQDFSDFDDMVKALFSQECPPPNSIVLDSEDIKTDFDMFSVLSNILSKGLKIKFPNKTLDTLSPQDIQVVRDYFHALGFYVFVGDSEIASSTTSGSKFLAPPYHIIPIKLFLNTKAQGTKVPIMFCKH